jgi:hypothetical protein
VQVRQHKQEQRQQVLGLLQQKAAHKPALDSLMEIAH